MAFYKLLVVTSTFWMVITLLVPPVNDSPIFVLAGVLSNEAAVLYACTPATFANPVVFKVCVSVPEQLKVVPDPPAVA